MKPYYHDDITTILPNNMFIETDCASGKTRRIMKSACTCGESFLIEYNTRSCRADGKRIFYPDREDAGWCAFRCRKCHQVVSDSVPGAQHGTTV